MIFNRFLNRTPPAPAIDRTVELSALAQLDSEISERFPALDARCQQATKAIDTIERQLDRAHIELQQANAARTAFNAGIDRRRNAIETRLRQSAPKVIDEALAALEERFLQLSRQFEFAGQPPVQDFHRGMYVPGSACINHAAIQKRAGEIAEARQVLDGLKLTAIDDDDLQLEIEAIITPLLGPLDD